MVEESRQSRIGNILESLVTAVILLVIAQTFLEDFSIIAGWSAKLNRVFIFTGFFFDFFFTVEFLVRLYNAFARRKGLFYLIHERGWIDFLASVPLLMLSSGPPMIAYILEGAAFAGFGGILNMLKLIKAIRIARILRLLRIIKIFRNIKYADSIMAQRHVSRVITISVTIVVFALFGYSVLSESVQSIGPDVGFRVRDNMLMAKLRSADSEARMKAIGLSDDLILVIKRGGITVYSRHDQSSFSEQFQPGDYKLVKAGGLEAYIDIRAQNEILARSQSWQTLFFFCIVLLLVVIYLVFYSPHFALTVTDPIHVMRKGFSEKDYNLEVKISEVYDNDDIFELARLYNEVYLPMKDRNRGESEEAAESNLKMDDIKEILE